MTNPITQAEAVANGVKFLETQTARPDWRERIGKKPFTAESMRSIDGCVLGRTKLWGYAALDLAASGFNPIDDSTEGWQASADEWNKALGLV